MFSFNEAKKYDSTSASMTGLLFFEEFVTL